ncbi:hydrogenase expression/formation protein [Methylomagnum sp.]
MTDSLSRFSLQAPYSPAGEEAPVYPDMPRMQTYATPSLYGLQADDSTRRVLQELRAALGNAESAGTFDLLTEAPETRRIVGEILGRGEVSIQGESGGERLLIEESVFAGVWREQHWRGDERVSDGLAVGPVPASVLDWAVRTEGRRGFDLPPEFPAGLMNAPSMLFEILGKARDYQPGRESILNLTLFPVTPEDGVFIEQELGFGGLQIVARGYGDCRVMLTAVPNVWWVRYFNSTGEPILNTLEITRLPAVALAAAEDLEDSRQRLGEVLEALG